MSKFGTLRAIVALLLCVLFGSVNAAIIFVGPFPASPPSYIPPLPSGTFLVPVEISDAANLQLWQFDLLFDNTVVEEVDPFDGSAGIYGAEFTPGDANTLSFILGGFPFNIFGLVDDVAGSYPTLLNGPSGDGVLAFVLFEFLPDQENNNPNFQIENTTVLQIPEPATVSLLAAALLIFGFTHRRMNSFRVPGAR
jgi:hypothetical protein